VHGRKKIKIASDLSLQNHTPIENLSTNPLRRDQKKPDRQNSSKACPTFFKSSPSKEKEGKGRAWLKDCEDRRRPPAIDEVFKAEKGGGIISV